MYYLHKCRFFWISFAETWQKCIVPLKGETCLLFTTKAHNEKDCLSSDHVEFINNITIHLCYLSNYLHVVSSSSSANKLICSVYCFMSFCEQCYNRYICCCFLPQSIELSLLNDGHFKQGQQVFFWATEKVRKYRYNTEKTVSCIKFILKCGF